MLTHPARLVASLLFIATAALALAANDLRLWYERPASVWVEALPVGNGRLGAMGFGGTASERIQFNEDTLWTGKPHNYVRAGSAEAVPEIRELLWQNRV